MIHERFDVLNPGWVVIYDVPYPTSEILLWHHGTWRRPSIREHGGDPETMSVASSQLWIPMLKTSVEGALFEYEVLTARLRHRFPSMDIMSFTTLQGQTVGERWDGMKTKINIGAFACTNREFVEGWGGSDRPEFFRLPVDKATPPVPPEQERPTAWAHLMGLGDD